VIGDRTRLEIGMRTPFCLTRRPVHAFVASAALLFCMASEAASPPVWPAPIAAAWPIQWASINYTGAFPDGPEPYTNVTTRSSWWFDWPTNRWRQDTCVKMSPDAAPSCHIELWAGNDRRDGASVGTTYTFSSDLTTCNYSPSMVPDITRPDSFAKADYGARIQVDGRWGDEWISDTSSWIHYNFSTTIDVATGFPLRDCGPTIPSPPYAYACSTHHHVHVADHYASAEWAAFFALPTHICNPKESQEERQLQAPFVPGTAWPGTLLLGASHTREEEASSAVPAGGPACASVAGSCMGTCSGDVADDGEYTVCSSMGGYCACTPCYARSAAFCTCQELVDKKIVPSLQNCTEGDIVVACKFNTCRHASGSMTGLW